MRKGIISKKAIIFGILLLFVGASVLQQSNMIVKADITDGLVGYWNFDEGSGTILHDSSSYGNDGTIYGNPTWTTGISGNAISFDGINDWIDCGNDGSLNPSTAITLAAWYKPTISWYGAGNDPIIDKPYDSGVSRRYQYHLGVCGDVYAANRPLSVMYDVDVGGTWESINAPPHTLAFDQWSFIVGTYDGTTMKLYVDNVLKSSKTVYGGITDYNQNLRIAKYIGNSGATFLPGVIDEIRIYNRALTADEVQELFNPPALVGYWNFDEGSGSIAHDSSGYGNDGIIHGGASWVNGISGNALSFDGTNDWIDCGNDASLNPSNAITLSAWYKPTISWHGAGSDPIIDKPYTSQTGPTYQYHLGVCGDLYPAPGSNLAAHFDMSPGGNWRWTHSPANTLSLNQWFFIVATYDGSAMKLFVDGELKSMETVSGTISNYGQHLNIAKYVPSSGAEIFLPGVIDEIRIYNRALNENEIIELADIVNQPPTADADGPYYAPVDTSITFDGSGSSDTDGSIDGYRWDFTNDGMYDTGWIDSPTTTHSYLSAGTYTVKLQVKDNDGEYDTDTATVTITLEGGAVPTSEANGPYSGYVNNPVIFSSSGTVGGSEGTIVSWYWTFGDEKVSSQQNPTHTYSSSGTFTVTLKVTNNYGQTDTDTTSATITEISPEQTLPIADAGGPYSGVVGSPITFDGSGSNDSDGRIVSYLWNFGDSTTGTGVSPTHTYTIPGNYTVILTVTDNDSLINSISTIVNINVSGPPTIIIAIASSNIEPMEEENEKTFSITVQCEHQPVRNIHLELLEQSNLTIISFPSNISLNPGESRELFITIKAPKLNDTNSPKEKISDETIILRAVGDGNVTSNTEQVNFKVIGKDATPGFETVATITAIGTAGALVTFFRRRNRNR